MINQLTKIVILAICNTIICVFALNGQQLQTGESKKIKKELLVEDIRILRNALTTCHTGLYSYTPEKKFLKVFEKLERSLKTMNEREFLAHIGILSNVIKNGHTEFSTSNKYWNFIKENVNVFPLKLRFINGKVYIFENLSASNSVRGGPELLEINGTKISKILKVIMPYVPGDGNNITGRYNTLSEKFYRYYYLFFDQSESFNVKIIDKGIESNSTIAGIKLETLESSQKVKHLLKYEVLTETTSILKLSTFDNRTIQESGIKFSSFIDSVFTKLKKSKVKNLILDLRDNSGGSDGNGNLLYSYLTDKEFDYYSRIEVLNPNLNFEDHLSNSDKEEWGEVKEYFKSYLTKNDAGTFNFDREPILGSNPPLVSNSSNFSGRLIVLINGGTFSAASELASFIHFNKKEAIFIGEETGGNYFFNVSGYMPTLVLPNTQVRIKIPFLKYFMDVDDYEKGRGVIPNKEIIPSIIDILEGKDVQKEYALKLVK